MADPIPRYQVGDQCYTGFDAALAAAGAAFKPYVTQYDFGGGMTAALMVSLGVGSEGDTPGEGWMSYRVDGWDSNIGGTEFIDLPFFAVTCQLDAEQSIRIADMSEAWVLFFGVLILVACMKGLQSIFNTGPND